MLDKLLDKLVNKIIFKSIKGGYEALSAIDEKADEKLKSEIYNTIVVHAMGAAAAGAASGWVPGAGGTALMAVTAGFIWDMYVKVGAKVGIRFSDDILKSIASGIGANLATTVVGMFVTTTITSFVPFLNIIIAPTVAFCMVWASAFIYIGFLVKIFEKDMNFQNLNKDDINDMTEEVIKDADISEIIKEAKQAYKNNK